MCLAKRVLIDLPTKVQRVFQVGAIRKILQDRLPGEQKVTAKMLKKHFDENLEIKSGEAVTEHFLTTAVALWNAMFSVPSLKDTVQSASDRFLIIKGDALIVIDLAYR